MRKLFLSVLLFLGTLMAGIVGSCTKPDFFNDNDGTTDRIMHFSVSKVVSKAVVTDDVFQREGTVFKVWGICRAISGSVATTKVFDGTEVTYNGTDWQYNDLQYWLPGFVYTFRAFYPKEVTANFDGNNLSVAGFNSASGIDLLLASPASVNCLPDKKMEPVQLNFRHLLSRVTFVGRSDEKNLGQGRLIVIDEARLYGLHTTGDWSGSTTGAGTWATGLAMVNRSNTPYLIDGKTYPDGLTLTPEGASLFGNELFIPQSLNDCILEIKFHYNVGEPKTFTRNVRLSAVSERWEAGKSYRYPFTIDEHIFFDPPKLIPWEYAPVHNTDFNIDHLQD